MNALSIVDNTVTMTSLELVDYINSERGEGEAELTHANFLAKVPKVLGEGGLIQFQDTYIHPQNGQAYPCYRFPKREACLMAMSYSYDLQAKVFDRMTVLEAQAEAMARFNLPKTYSEAMRLAADQAEQIEAQQAQLALAAPKVAFVERYVEATGLKGFREVCKLLKANEARFREFVTEKKILYKLGGAWTAYQQHLDAGRFEVRTGVADSEHAFSTTKFTAKGVDWIAGEWAKHQLREGGAA